MAAKQQRRQQQQQIRLPGQQHSTAGSSSVAKHACGNVQHLLPAQV
jgi:hypothetical protein